MVQVAQRMLPVWPTEYRPGWGQTSSPCGPGRTAMRWVTFPLEVLKTYTTEL